MTSIPFSRAAIQSYLGTEGYNSCQDICSIHVEHFDSARNEITVEGKIPASTTRQARYTITVKVPANGRSVLSTSCDCPVGHKCKHIHKVLYRIRASPQSPIQVPVEKLPTGMHDAGRSRIKWHAVHASTLLTPASRNWIVVVISNHIISKRIMTMKHWVCSLLWQELTSVLKITLKTS